MSKPEIPADTGLLDYLAFLLSWDSKGKNSIPPRWLCTRADVRADWLETAKEKYLLWVESEREAEVRRGSP